MKADAAIWQVAADMITQDGAVAELVVWRNQMIPVEQDLCDDA
jgi:hypothetical protein